MNDQAFQVGDVIVNEVRQYAKVISFRNGVYGLSGWTTQANAEKATVVQKFLNTYGVAQASFRLVKGAPSKNAPALDESTDKKPSKSSLKKLNVEQLRALAEKDGVSTEGIKPEVLERLFAHFEI